MSDELLQQVIIVNKDLHMGKGKIAAQVAHGTTKYISEIMFIMSNNGMQSSQVINFKQWMNDGMMMKIVLKASEEELRTIAKTWGGNILLFVVIDRGFTQLEPDSLTCIATEPIAKDMSDKIFGHLKLL